MSKENGPGTSVDVSIAPMLSVRRGARAVEFYKTAFGATEVFRIESPDGAGKSVTSWLARPSASREMAPTSRRE